jgi:predicted Rossmann fold flavoprotein
MCAIEAGKRGRRVLLLDHAKAAGEKIRISGGGRCNFTNLHATPENYYSNNPRFCISALRRYAPQDFIALVDAHGIAWHEKTLGQLFCDGSARQIVDMLLAECRDAGVRVQLETTVEAVARTDTGFALETSRGPLDCTSLVIATGGKSIPKMGATGFGYDIARQFGLPLVLPRPALVPLTFGEEDRSWMAELSGVSITATVECRGERFTEGLLFTHRGLSGPAILQISSVWREGDSLTIDLAPATDIHAMFQEAKKATPRQSVKTLLSSTLPARLAERMASDAPAGNIADIPDRRLTAVAGAVKKWRVTPVGSEGYRTAEVTIGGVDTRALSSRTFECNDVPGLYFIGEVLDVTGWLGGYNFQWAWASGHAAGAYA